VADKQPVVLRGEDGLSRKLDDPGLIPHMYRHFILSLNSGPTVYPVQ
jgi:hypothetical protein